MSNELAMEPAQYDASVQCCLTDVDGSALSFPTYEAIEAYLADVDRQRDACLQPPLPPPPPPPAPKKASRKRQQPTPGKRILPLHTAAAVGKHDT